MGWKAIKTVYSESTGEKYYIKQSVKSKEYSCTCKSFIFNQEDPKTCKHIRAIVTQLKAKKKKKKPLIDSYWIVINHNGKLAKESLFDAESSAKWWANYFNNHYMYPDIDYSVVKVTLKRSK